MLTIILHLPALCLCTKFMQYQIVIFEKRGLTIWKYMVAINIHNNSNIEYIVLGTIVDVYQIHSNF